MKIGGVFNDLKVVNFTKIGGKFCQKCKRGSFEFAKTKCVPLLPTVAELGMNHKGRGFHITKFRSPLSFSCLYFLKFTPKFLGSLYHGKSRSSIEQTAYKVPNSWHDFY